MRVGNYKLENIYLTAASTVGMQWIEWEKKVPKNTLTIWLDSKGNLRNTTSNGPVPMDLYLRMLDYYEENEGKLLNETLH